MKQKLWLKIYGDVQGVGFRYSAWRKAGALGLTGWVRNCPDGCVETEAEGEEEALQEYCKWCKSGPVSVNVSKVEEKWVDAAGLYQEFNIRD